MRLRRGDQIFLKTLFGEGPHSTRPNLHDSTALKKLPAKLPSEPRPSRTHLTPGPESQHFEAALPAVTSRSLRVTQ